MAIPHLAGTINDGSHSEMGEMALAILLRGQCHFALIRHEELDHVLLAFGDMSADLSLRLLSVSLSQRLQDGFMVFQ
jgi:hypothetical protein